MQILNIHAVIAKTSLKRATIYSYIKEGKFPAPVKVGTRANGWVEAEVDAWLQSRVDASRDKSAGAGQVAA